MLPDFAEAGLDACLHTVADAGLDNVLAEDGLGSVFIGERGDLAEPGLDTAGDVLEIPDETALGERPEECLDVLLEADTSE